MHPPLVTSMIAGLHSNSNSKVCFLVCSSLELIFISLCVCVYVCVCVCVQVLPPLLLGLCHLQGQLTIVQTSVILPSVHSVITVCHTYLLRLASLYYNCYFPLLLRPRCCRYYCLCCIHSPICLCQVLIALHQVDRWSVEGPEHWIRV